MKGWEDEPPAADDDGPPGYTFPPYFVPRQTKILNGCPRCSGMVTFRHRDGAKWCERCQRTFYPMSEDSVIRFSPDKAA